MNKKSVKNLIYSALFLAIGMVLPMLTGQIKEIGDTLLPMHLPVLLCGLICGKWYGLGVGALLPFLRSAVFAMPPIYPNAVYMALELLTYGFVVGLIYSCLKKPSLKNIYLSLIPAMLAGRIVWGIAKAVLLGMGGKTFTFLAFITGGFVDSLLGIALQLILIPIIIKLLTLKKT